jgi:hypothetical protein
MTLNGSWRAATVRAQFSTMLAMALTCGCGMPVATADDQEAITEAGSQAGHGHDRNPNPQLFEIDSHPYGIRMQEWAYNWMRWEYSIAAATNPTIVPGASYDQHQIGPVYFVPDGPNHNDAFSVPHHKAVAIMLSQIGNDYPCPDPTFKPAPGQSLFDFLATGLTKVNDNIVVLEVTLDGVPIKDPASYRFTSTRLFYFVGDKSLAASFDACVTGSFQPAVADDLFLLFKPLPRGQHVLTTHIINADGDVFDRTRTITSE